MPKNEHHHVDAASGISDPFSENHAAQLQAALALHQKGHLAEAEILYKEILHSQPDHFDTLQLLATIAGQQNKLTEAVELFDRALKINPNHPASLNNCGNTLLMLKRYDEALLSYDRAIAVQPDNADTYCNRGVVLQALKRYEEAVASYDRAVALRPAYALAYNNRSFTLLELKRYDEAVMSYDRTIALNANYPEPHYNRGNALLELKRYEEAILSYNKALKIKPNYAEAYGNRGSAFQKLNRLEDAISSYEQAMSLKSDYDFLFGQWLHTKMKICDWNTFENDIHLLSEKIMLHKNAISPFSCLSLIDSLSLQKKVSEIFVTKKYPCVQTQPEISKHAQRDKIRIGYYSADYHNHAMMYLMAELFEKHDRRKFEIIAFSIGPVRTDGMRKRAAAAFDRFIDVHNQSDEEVAQLSRDLEVDIAVDLNGFTTNCRTGIFALRAAPIQVSYLGYPGTMGADYIDYLIADSTLIPHKSRPFYTEKIVSLPDSYQVNDATRYIAEKVFTREELGLPTTGFIFCCFNNNHKITPTNFDGWIRILKKVEGSVLWLIEDNQKAAENLQKEAVELGITAERLIFAKRMPLDDHLARHRAADLFLDTLPYNAHTTASDALWAGLPVLTCIGEAFAARVAASLLNAIQLPELITSTQEEYEALAVELASKKIGSRLRCLIQNSSPATSRKLIQQCMRGIRLICCLIILYCNRKKSYQQRPTMPKHENHNVADQSGIPSPSSAHNHAVLLQKALALHQQGRLGEAEALYKEILHFHPDHFDALQLLATIAGQQNRLSEAVELFHRALTVNPDHPASLNNCGNALQMLKRYEEALLSYDKSISIQPDNADTWCNRGVVLQAIKRYEEALASYEKAISLKPRYPLAYNNRSFTLLELKRYEEAVLSYDKTIALNPNYPEPHYNRGNALVELRRYEEAILSYDKAIEMKSDYADAYGNRGNAFQELMRYEDAVSSYERAIKIKPNEQLLSNLGITFQKEGLHPQEAEACFRQALVLNPDSNESRSNLLFFLTHNADITSELLYQEHLAFEARLEAQIKETPPAYDNPKDPDRRLNIGFVSGDFRNHPIALVIEPVWQMFDKEKFKLIAYYNYGSEDQVTERMRGKVQVWRQVFEMNDLALAEQIRADGIDILVDLSGHTGFNRLPMFALKPAPVQVSWIGYPATTGLKAMDYRIMDKHCAPVGLLDWQFSEKLVYLPSSSVFHIPNDIPGLNHLPALTSKIFTFGSFNRLSKAGDCVIELWSKVLKAVPDSRMVLGGVSDIMQQNLFTTLFEQHGIARERLLFHPRVPMYDYLKYHHEIDLLLDSFPYSGGTTTNHGLSMGVPTITLTGPTLPSRQSTTILGRVGLECFVSKNHDEYVEKAVYWSAHLEELNKIRSGLRDRITNSRMRSPDFVQKALESALRQMWQRWCAGIPPESFEVQS
jgi:predicted O-linked N-acetylglucosamine transferase (SPINDLY family)